METRKTPLQPGKYFHIYNRGINGQNIFLEEKNYSYFLEKYSQYVSPYTDTFAYCLLRNHFHLLIRAKEEEEIRRILNGKKVNKSVSWHLSNVFASLFKSYAQAINKRYNRTGGLFEEPFHRIEVSDDSYFTRLVWYIHHNPQKHGFVSDYRDYAHSRFHSHLQEKKTTLNRKEVLDWFGGKDRYLNFHEIQHNMDAKFVIEFD
jgi:REP element-mobilizing transposase RayT